MSKPAPAPSRPALGPVDTKKIRARQWPRPVFKATSRIGTPPPSRQLRLLGQRWFQQPHVLGSFLEVSNSLACRRDAPPGFRAAPRAVFAVTAIRLQSLTHLRACGAARFACLQGIGARPIPAARSLAPL